METNVMEYKCPCCEAGLRFSGDSQQLTCEYCDTTFEINAVRAYNEASCKDQTGEFVWEQEGPQMFSDTENAQMQAFICPSCGGEIISDGNTAATFCPYCDNPTIMPARLSGGLKPDGVLPFKTTKEDAQAAFLQLCKGKPLLPAEFTRKQRLEKITGMYVPFWLYNCSGSFEGNYKATRIHRWSDSRYNYTRTEHFLLERAADAEFLGIPMDGSSKMDDTFMESIEPYDYQAIQPFEMAYLTGFVADKYDVPYENGIERVRQRVENAIRDQVQSSLIGYSTTVPTAQNVNVSHSKAQYVLLPVWMLNTKYKGKIYTFAMNGQTGKMTGSLPVCGKRAALWFSGIFAGVTLLTSLVQLIANL